MAWTGQPGAALWILPARVSPSQRPQPVSKELMGPEALGKAVVVLPWAPNSHLQPLWLL
jgi:hypothetical protein